MDLNGFTPPRNIPREYYAATLLGYPITPETLAEYATPAELGVALPEILSGEDDQWSPYVLLLHANGNRLGLIIEINTGTLTYRQMDVYPNEENPVRYVAGVASQILLRRNYLVRRESDQSYRERRELRRILEDHKFEEEFGNV